MYVREYLAFVASIYNGKPAKSTIDNIVELTGLVPEQNKKIGSLSKGYRQRVGLAQALIHNPGVLILDEPTTGLDPNQIIEIRTLIKEAGKEKTVLLSTHIMQEVEAICERVIIIDKGKIVANEEKNNIYSILKKPGQLVKIEFDTNPEIQALSGLEGISRVNKVKENVYLIEASGSSDIRPVIFQFAVKNGLTVLSLQQQEGSLEEVFRQLTKS
jgi:ABC-2 type transport system ATP-binding protein